MRKLKYTLFFAPSIAAFLLGGSLAASVYAQTSLPEENRRLIERYDERMTAMMAQMTAIDHRLARLELYILGVFATTGGVGAIVGSEKAKAWRRSKRSS